MCQKPGEFNGDKLMNRTICEAHSLAKKANNQMK